MTKCRHCGGDAKGSSCLNCQCGLCKKCYDGLRFCRECCDLGWNECRNCKKVLEPIKGDYFSVGEVCDVCGWCMCLDCYKICIMCKVCIEEGDNGPCHFCGAMGAMVETYRGENGLHCTKRECAMKASSEMREYFAMKDREVDIEIEKMSDLLEEKRIE
jgi:hypothetical protein